MKRLTYIIIISLLFTGCSRKFGIEHGIEPEKRLDIEVKKGRCALIRTRICNVSIETIDAPKWEKLLKQKVFTKDKKTHVGIRIPRLVFFHILISNTGKTPIRIDSITLSYDKVEKNPISRKEAIKRCKSPAYSAFNFNSILTPKRLIGESCCLKKINYDMDVIDYKLNFINPGDRIIRIEAFDWIPVQFRNLRITIRISSIGDSLTKKIVDFNFKRCEYRTKGRYYLRPKARSEDKE